MDINGQYDDNAADLRNVTADNQADTQLPETNVSIAVGTDNIKRQVSLVEIILALGILVGFVLIVYLFLQRQSAGSAVPLSPPQFVTPSFNNKFNSPAGAKK